MPSRKAPPHLFARPSVKRLALAFVALAFARAGYAAESPLQSFTKDIQPVLDEYCYDCHGNGFKKGGVQLDDFKTDADIQDHALWWRVMKNVRAGIMPPATEARVPSEDVKKLMTWIKLDAFSLDPAHPDPGRVTLRRLNRVEYRNTIFDLTGAKFDTLKEFPADDTGQGFDNLSDVLTISPMLLERYLDAAQTIISETVPSQPLVVAKETLSGRMFTAVTVSAAGAAATSSAVSNTAVQPALPAQPAFKRPAPAIEGSALDLSYYTPSIVAKTFKAGHEGKYQVSVNISAVEKYVDDQFDLNRCRLIFKADGETLINQEFVRESDKVFEYSFERTWPAGDHVLTFEVQPIGPDKTQFRLLRIRLNSVTISGPEAPEFWVQPDNYARFFPRKVPWWPASRKRYATELLRNFASRAFRRPVDNDTVQRLVAMEESVSAQPGSTFEAGMAQAMVAVLASPRFIFRQEDVEPLQVGQANPYVDEYALASRLSYFFWSSMPDAALFELAGKGELRAHLPEQIARMLADPHASEFISNFTGQWLEARDIGEVQINPLAIYLREHPNLEAEQALDTFRRVSKIADEKRTAEDKAAFAKARAAFFTVFRAPKAQLTDSLRYAMRRESEMSFAYVIKEDRSLVELIDSNYTFLNEELAKHYGIPGVTGKEMRKVMLPADSPRGGILTQGTVLAVTSNPTRTSPVKRGVFILDAILGTRPPPPPPNIPALEDAASPEKLRTMTLRENLALHASNKACASCHSRMDPLGLALENFNAMGAWRDSELNRPIDPGGKLITGETFKNVRELKHILATNHKRDFYYCISQKLMTYALGRALDYYDVETVDQLVAQLEATDGRPSVLLQGIVNSAAFQQRRQQPKEDLATNTPASTSSDHVGE
jgi:mono/diheme cytochrome c family protein